MPIYTDKKTGRLYIEFQYKGERYKERLPAEASKKDAKKLEVKIKNDLMFESHGVETQKPLTFERFIDEHFGPYAELHYSPDRYERTTILLKTALPFLKGKRMRNIKAADMERVKASRANLLTMHDKPRKPATIEREMCEISAVFAMAVKNDLIDYNPCSRVRKLSFDNIQDKILRREDEDAFFANIKTRWATDVCKMVLNTGLRQNDLMNLTRFQIDRDRGLITLIQGKTKRRVVIALNSVALEIINRRWRNGQKLLFASPITGRNDGSVRPSIQKACRLAKIPILTIRDLRRTFGTRLIENGADAVTAARSLGHSDLRMLPRYARSVDLMQKAVDNLVNPATSPPAAYSENVESIEKKKLRSK